MIFAKADLLSLGSYYLHEAFVNPYIFQFLTYNRAQRTTQINDGPVIMAEAQKAFLSVWVHNITSLYKTVTLDFSSEVHHSW